MKVCTDLRRLRISAAQRHDQAVEFRSYIAQLVLLDSELDATVTALTYEAMGQVDCVECHNCCVVQTAQATVAEVALMSDWLGISADVFSNQHLVDSPLADPVLRKHGVGSESVGGCSLLCQGRCTVYDVRPARCRAFPLLLGDHFRTRLWSIVDNCHVCPIVAAVFQELELVMRP